MGVVTTSILGAGHVNAQSPQPTAAAQRPFYQSLIDKIASTFNVDKSKVEDVVNQWHSENKQKMMDTMKQRMDDKLSQAVKDGKITEAQKTAIIKRLSEEKNSFNKEEIEDMTPEQRKTAMQNKRTELENWAKSQGIDPNLLKEYGMGRRGGGFGHMKGQ